MVVTQLTTLTQSLKDLTQVTMGTTLCQSSWTAQKLGGKKKKTTTGWLVSLCFEPSQPLVG